MAMPHKGAAALIMRCRLMLTLLCACFGSAVAVSGTRQGETLQSLVTPVFAGFPPIDQSGIKAASTTGMTTDRKNFIFFARRGIMAEIEYPGVAPLVGRDIWDVEVGCSSHLTRTKPPLKSTISEGVFLILCLLRRNF